MPWKDRRVWRSVNGRSWGTSAGSQSPVAENAASRKTAEVAKAFLAQAKQILAREPKANFHTMRGFAGKPKLPSYQEVYGLRAAAIAVYPMYKGLARLVGMDIVGKAQTLGEQIDLLAQNWKDYDFFFLHFKYTDSTGEDGNFDAKVKRIEELDAAVPRITALNPTVLIVTGDHSTPAVLKAHSPHPVPFLIHAPTVRADGIREFGERSCARGAWGVIPGTALMPLALGYAGKLAKYGA